MVNTKLVELGIKALENANKIVEKLGEKGTESVKKNPHGDTSLVGDIEAEKAVIDTFRKSGIPLRIISEEHGTVDLSDDPQFLAVLDGIDGSKEYKKNREKGRYCTMFGIFSNLDPKYGEYIFAGVMEHSTKKIFYASKGNGSFMIINGKEEKINTTNCKKLDKETKIYADIEYDKNRGITFIHDTFLSKLEGYKFMFQCSSAVHYTDLASGKVDLTLECTRKGNLEIAAAFGLVKEAGGAIVTIDGSSIGNKKYLELGQDKDIPIITSSSVELVCELIRIID